MNYQAFLESKALRVAPVGFDPKRLTSKLMPFQRDIVTLACKLGRFCVWADCGMGKTLMQLEWAHQVARLTQQRVLILAPLAVSHQTVREAEKFKIPGVSYVAQPTDHDSAIVVTNYQKLERFNPADYAGIVLDESSILKSMDGKTRSAILDAFRETPYRLACSATPAPNDYMELGNHAEFVGVMTREEMLAMFFVHDGGDTSKWRLKGHATEKFWQWVCSWAVTIRKPSDLGYEDGAFKLPPLEMSDVVVETPHELLTDAVGQTSLFPQQAQTLNDQRAVQRSSLENRVAAAAKLANQPGQWMVWCHLNDESAALTAAIDGAVEVSGSDSDEKKILSAMWFAGETCLCNEPLFRDKLSAWKSVDDRTRSTCESITSATKRTGTSEPESSGIDTTQDDASNIEQMQASATRQRLTPKDGSAKTQKNDSPNVSDPTGSHQTNTEHFSSHKVTSARSVVSQRKKETTEHQNSTSTTATRTEQSEDCSATVAIWGSANSATTQRDSKLPRCICGHESGRRVLVSKGSIFGWGLNFQNCHQVVFVGMSHSYEQYYQSIRRCWRFGQTEAVQCHVVYDWAEGAVIDNIRRKDADADAMASAMVEIMRANTLEQLQQVQRQVTPYQTKAEQGQGWVAYMGDCVEGISRLADNIIHYSIFSPPFASLYTYSNSDRDMGNCKTSEEFHEHFRFLVRELHRVLKPGRLVSFHCMNLPRSKSRDGVIGVWDFRGAMIRAFEAEGFVFHSEVCIWKDPVTAMQRTKALGLLHKQIVKDSAMSRQGVPDYLVTMRKRGDNEEPIAGKLKDFQGEDPPRVTGDETRDSIKIWQRYASPVWMDINPSDTLQFRNARDNDDERHICPLQLDVIRRGVQLWSNPGDVVLSPFMGIGSEGHVALEMGRVFVGFELKPSYYECAVKNLAEAVKLKDQQTLFAEP